MDDRIVACENMTTSAAFAKIHICLEADIEQDHANFKEAMLFDWTGEISL